jgi:glycosyltransferase involved in cell wall biosynthesis
VSGLSDSLADLGLETHLWFVGDPGAPGVEDRGELHLHRWCQWISNHHPGGVYDGEDGKEFDYASSLPPYLLYETLLPELRAGGQAVVLAEEWHTANAVLHLDWLLRGEGLRSQVRILWNANNVFGFDRIDWGRMREAATITTVSRYMKHLMWKLGVNPLVIPNGLSRDSYLPPDDEAVAELRRLFTDRVILTKMARFDPDKRWLLAIETLAELKRQGVRPLLIARGGVEEHGRDVLARAAAAGLSVCDRSSGARGPGGLVETLREARHADIVQLTSLVDGDARRTLFRAADAVLANSGHEPFGLVGLETMAAGGVACTGCTGEDYAVAGKNAVVLETADPRELVVALRELQKDPERERALRRAGQATAREYAWPSVIRRSLLPRVSLEAA